MLEAPGKLFFFYYFWVHYCLLSECPSPDLLPSSSLSLSAERIGRMMQLTSLVFGSSNSPLSNVPHPKGIIRGSIQCFTSCNMELIQSLRRDPGARWHYRNIANICSTKMLFHIELMNEASGAYFCTEVSSIILRRALTWGLVRLSSSGSRDRLLSR